MPLQRSEVVDAALTLLDDIGLDALSTRRLATELGVRPGALYWHVKNKQDLLDALAEKILGELSPPADGGDWRETVRAMAVNLREVLLAHRDAARLVAGSAWLGPNRLGFADGLMGVLRGTGAPIAAVAYGCDTVLSYVTGFALQEQGESDTPTGEDSVRRKPARGESAGQEPAPSEPASPAGVATVASGPASQAPDFGPFPHLGAWVAEWNSGVRQDTFTAGLEILIGGLDRYLTARTGH
ncbi:TetR/AcrR family transcriptional regulator C-terminal domain-containing protein [Streptomyces sp. NBC_01257]|uniref:TetR/AcrR family transcriptional regulator C-terminal domain-containing protein n=1 Tax=Streptomyces sp. NBC_01257 TaxID=2903799 RepID=UPI002DDA0C91|nr:TetR/AcrR family transcriptional regulator C-terminal domain-containing protein [Streptomyces sp. NBC_01257]WRZ67343.1 TetR/AcrR family transcriptional regulator C-terminal domain-containing protein [Streptomyces sp. NBC_01257]